MNIHNVRECSEGEQKVPITVFQFYRVISSRSDIYVQGVKTLNLMGTWFVLGNAKIWYTKWNKSMPTASERNSAGWTSKYAIHFNAAEIATFTAVTIHNKPLSV
jgi:hypothetical protein